MASSAAVVVKDSNSENIKVAISKGVATDMEDEEDDLFEIDLEAVDSIPPVPHYRESYFTATTNTTTLLANCLLPISDVSSAIPMVSTACVTNRVADALSRRVNLLTTMTVRVPGFDSFRELFDSDPYFSGVIAAARTGENSEFLLVDGFLFRGNQLCIPDCSLRLQIIKESHGEGHVGRDRTLQLVKGSYFWPTIRKEVEKYVARCQICQLSKGKATNAASPCSGFSLCIEVDSSNREAKVIVGSKNFGVEVVS
ncbi:hypothetical protein LWI29_033953 [Acer saccharum]|uniref:Integrase zinc-binding domain-containing protein n=1 Tax=Acer saccharum TaxID=4024 RepID=A0AA39RYB0_ACESA|nr:hypothetical protein LWI29_033953 [Acer saccharum]